MANLTDVSEKDKQKFEKQLNAFIGKLDKRVMREEAASNKETNELEKLTAKHELKVKKLTERQLFIKQEIERIEKEIEEISKQEEIMWNEYRRAKEEAKKEKLEYMAEKRKEKQAKKQTKSTDSTVNKEEVEVNENSQADAKVTKSETDNSNKTVSEENSENK